MRVLVTGSRGWPDPWDVWNDLRILYGNSDGPMTVVHGACPKGADLFAALWCTQARKEGLDVIEERHPAKWHRPDGSLNKGAGFQRNQEMVNLGADVLLAYIWQNSRGATHTKECAGWAGMDMVVRTEPTPEIMREALR